MTDNNPLPPPAPTTTPTPPTPPQSQVNVPPVPGGTPYGEKAPSDKEMAVTHAKAEALVKGQDPKEVKPDEVVVAGGGGNKKKKLGRIFKVGGAVLGIFLLVGAIAAATGLVQIPGIGETRRSASGKSCKLIKGKYVCKTTPPKTKKPEPPPTKSDPTPTPEKTKPPDPTPDIGGVSCVKGNCSFPNKQCINGSLNECLTDSGFCEGTGKWKDLQKSCSAVKEEPGKGSDKCYQGCKAKFDGTIECKKGYLATCTVTNDSCDGFGRWIMNGEKCGAGAKSGIGKGGEARAADDIVPVSGCSNNITWCGSFECPKGDTDGDGTCNPTGPDGGPGDEGATYVLYDGENCPAVSCGQVDYFSGGTKGQSWDKFCRFDFYGGFPTCGSGPGSNTPIAPTPPKEPVPGLFCSDLSFSSQSPKYGGSVELTCSSPQQTPIDHFEFRFRTNDTGSWSVLDSGTSRSVSGEYVGTSSLNIKRANVSYSVQCRSCKDAGNNECSNWGLNQ